MDYLLGLGNFEFNLYTFAVFYGVLFIPVLFVCLKIIYYPIPLPYLLVNWIVLIFNLPLIVLYPLIDNWGLFSVNNISFFTVVMVLYNLPVILVLSFVVFKYKYQYKLAQHIRNIAKFYNNKQFVKILALMFLLYNALEFILYYILYYI